MLHWAKRAVGFVAGVLSLRESVRIRLTTQVEATIYDRPGEWMPDADLDRLRRDIQQVAKDAIPGKLEYGVFLPTRAPFANRLIVVGRHLGGDVVGFNAMAHLDLLVQGRPVSVLHLGLLAIHPRYQRQGFQGLLYGLGAFSAFYRIRERPVWVSNVTEVPAVFGAVSDYFLDAYPSYQRRPPAPEAHRRIAQAIMANHRHEFGVGPEAVFDSERFVIQGSYSGGSDALKKSFDSAPKYRVQAANDFCREQLDYQRGDDFLQIATLDSSVISRWLERRIPAELRPAAARQMRFWQYPAAKAAR